MKHTTNPALEALRHAVAKGMAEHGAIEEIRACLNCKESFTPDYAGQDVCSAYCFTQHVRQYSDTKTSTNQTPKTHRKL